jgi:hypothetical protein
MAEGRGSILLSYQELQGRTSIHFILADLKMRDTFFQRLRHRFDASHHLVLWYDYEEAEDPLRSHWL